jgi:hypothetical protein
MSAAHAAAIARRRREEEEEHMTPYRPRDLSENWEFKILRSASGAFRSPEVLNRCLNEEAHAGWMMVEKFDDSRVRLKRPATARQNDDTLPFDPYRTTVGLTETKLVLLAVGGALGGIAAIVAIILLCVNGI